MTLRLWLATFQPDHEPHTILGVATTPEDAALIVEAHLADASPWVTNQLGEWQIADDGSRWLPTGRFDGYEVEPLDVLGLTGREEWRVTGQPNPVTRDGETIHEFPPYTYVWNDATTRTHANGKTPEQAARDFVAAMGEAWTDGPHLHRRTHTIGDWEPVQ